ncbi:hypothetical protein CYLTODRAFT_444406 [Cylindrobasidium torrendii FP15055 ss-10]|uniref:Uncharacterized protein n=1 Tax=Cylindrobasidium torrendii FP15055 ss-10 TaxID=1314674 RepID=A0A0D7B8K8_9AGAR|nr:hypothetical protein CYLTODRAFT_444406 [Cylindrobasidium torrendii FP15055 ss-10]
MPATLSVAPSLSGTHGLSHSSMPTPDGDVHEQYDNNFPYAWQIAHAYAGNPYPVVPPPPAHKVWILDCKGCGTFLTNRGMKAVLLLRPNLALYSSDALPINCSAYTYNADALRPPTCHAPPAGPPRTCECLTQTLCCHGCGSPVGYMIVIPCARCTSSASASSRTTNGHRFVFHSNEIVGHERLYVQDEPGVLPHCETTAYPEHQLPRFNPHRESTPAYGDEFTTHYYPSSPPPLDPASDSSEDFMYSDYDGNSHLSSPRNRRLSSDSESDWDTSDGLPPPLVESPYIYGLPTEQCSIPPPRKLTPGDNVYWHNLARHGEIPGVNDDVRARHKPTSPRSTISAAKRAPCIYDR